MSAQKVQAAAAEAIMTMSAIDGGDPEGKPMPIRVVLPDWREQPAGEEQIFTVTKTGRLNRTDRQAGALPGKPDGDPLFGDDLTWSCYRCTVDAGAAGQIEHLFLFNLIVSLEWHPSARYLRQLRRGLTQASNLLYDVTNGQMGIGKVIIADDSWRACADIQMLASNRLLPRSWTGGLVMPAKYAPIRVGRGVRVRDRREILNWDEADAYHTLVHEWLHYALGLRDQYMAEPRPYSAAGSAPVMLVLPISGHGNTSIMSTPVGNSELFSQEPDPTDGAEFYGGDFGQVPYPGFEPKIGRRDPGPYALPLPLPIFRLAGTLQRDGALVEVMQTPDYLRLRDKLAGTGEDELPLPQSDLFAPFQIDEPSTFTRWDVALLTGDVGAGDARVVGQGFVDATALNEDVRRFGLCGFTEGASVLVNGTYMAGSGSSLATYRGVGLGELQEVQAPDERPLVDVFVVPGQTGDIRDLTVAAEVAGADWEATLLPHGQQGIVASALDGQILLTRKDGTQLICSYSRGGVPPTIGNTPTNPISAGSADGGSLIFGHADKVKEWPIFELASKTIVVTTSIPWLPDDKPQINRAGLQSVRPLSNIFSLTSNLSFAKLTNGGTALHPTLVIFYEAAALVNGEETPLLCRHDGKGNAWTPVATAMAQDLLVAMALNRDGAPGLHAEGEKLVERYCLFAVRTGGGSAVASLVPNDAGVSAAD